MDGVVLHKFASVVQGKICAAICSSRTAKNELTPPDLERFRYRFALPPSGAKLEAWEKLKECERRLSVYKWAEALNEPRHPQSRVFLDDCVSATLLTIEATLQFTLQRFELVGRSDFWQWLDGLAEYDVCLRGLRALRHFAAHVEVKPARSLVRLAIGGSRPDGTSETTVTRDWQLPQLDANALAKLKTKPLPEAMVPDWNQLASETPAPAVFERALQQIAGILAKAEAVT